MVNWAQTFLTHSLPDLRVFLALRVYSAFLCISLHFTAFLCTSLHLTALLCISLHFFACLCISLYFFAFFCISLNVSAFRCIFLHFSTFHCIFLHVSAFLCISLYFTTFLHDTICNSVIINSPKGKKAAGHSPFRRFRASCDCEAGCKRGGMASIKCCHVALVFGTFLG